MTFEVPGVFHSFYQWGGDRLFHVLGAISEHVEDSGGQFEDWHVVDVLADFAPFTSQSSYALAKALVDCGYVFVDHGESVLKSKSVEEHQAPDAERGGSVFFPGRCWR